MERLIIHYKNGSFLEINNVSSYAISGGYLIVTANVVSDHEEPIINFVNTIYSFGEIKSFVTSMKTKKYELND